ncbi:hypothetical protein [Amycolatopsis sp. SID8362]|uniref:hypothetical protein n=1 Tax=Amycolatopsis sp. SID8362 TaxID=2690346 RepID=UPI00136FEB58|nr:hypothetical protein [Amycolatopsis sp. SID8362]NBH02008.1 hypothetical protein [Amycolatopsis sp. SID8362]NED38711.1 hypothetical protein [Amycolatopsis sp. SID8362]
MLTRLSPLSELATRLRTAQFPLATEWRAVDGWFRPWAAQSGLRDELRNQLRTLSGAQATKVLRSSRETTTHFAWCLLDSPADPFSFWLHEYKAQEDWREGYADSVHNHRYHFCTTILRGDYFHERYETTIDAGTGLIESARLRRRALCQAGDCATMLADQFHRIPEAAAGTMTFLVKSRPVSSFSLSFDPASGIGHRHVPVESRLGELADRI